MHEKAVQAIFMILVFTSWKNILQFEIGKKNLSAASVYGAMISFLHSWSHIRSILDSLLYLLAYFFTCRKTIHCFKDFSTARWIHSTCTKRRCEQSFSIIEVPRLWKLPTWIMLPDLQRWEALVSLPNHYLLEQSCYLENQRIFLLPQCLSIAATRLKFLVKRFSGNQRFPSPQ